jgi:tRNA threonylcarbamoyladenosine biosynthesis protein TsaB
MAVAKGLALAQGLPLVGVPTLDVIATAQGKSRQPLCAVLQAGRGRICVSTYRWREGAWSAREEPHLTTWQNLVQATSSPTLFCGEIDSTGAETLATLGELATLLPAAMRLRRAGFLAEIAWRRLNQGEIDDPVTLTPIYLQHPV